MALLFGLGIAFMGIGFLFRRPWTIALPFLVWIGIDALARVGILPGQSDLGAAVLAGVVGALFAVAGIIFGNAQARRLPPA